jgi:hypothetical protein
MGEGGHKERVKRALWWMSFVLLYENRKKMKPVCSKQRGTEDEGKQWRV